MPRPPTGETFTTPALPPPLPVPVLTVRPAATVTATWLFLMTMLPVLPVRSRFVAVRTLIVPA